MNKAIGFIGIDAYDIILYLARISYNNNEKVLLVDNSFSKSLMSCIPNLYELNSNNDFIDYRGIDFTTIPLENVESVEYDKVFVYYGLYNTCNKYNICDYYILITDIQLHHILAIKELKLDISKVMHVIMKDVYEILLPENKILKLLGLPGEVKIYTHYLHTWDIKYRVVCQEQNLTSFRKISNSLKEYLYEISKMLYPEQSIKQLNNIIKKALKGN